MKAALCKRLDGPEGIVIEDIPEPSPGPGEALVKVKAAALNFLDTLITRGKYQSKPDLPFSPAAEIAGVVEAIGPDVTGVRVGERVMACLGWGGAREKVVAPATALVAIPEGVSDEVAAGLSVTYGTAIHGLKDRGRLRPGETVAVLGAAGGAGLAAVEIAKLMGARVIAVASSEEKLAVCRDHSADELLNYRATDLKDRPARADRRRRRRRRLRLRRGRRRGGGAAGDRLAGALSRDRLRLRRDPQDPAQPAPAQRRRRHRRVLGRGGKARSWRPPPQHERGALLGRAGKARPARARDLPACGHSRRDSACSRSARPSARSC